MFLFLFLLHPRKPPPPNTFRNQTQQQTQTKNQQEPKEQHVSLPFPSPPTKASSSKHLPKSDTTTNPNQKSARTQGATCFSSFSFSTHESLLLQTPSEIRHPLLHFHLHSRFPQLPNLTAVVKCWFLRP
jgi:hypothetical protein